MTVFIPILLAAIAIWFLYRTHGGNAPESLEEQRAVLYEAAGTDADENAGSNDGYENAGSNNGDDADDNDGESMEEDKEKEQQQVGTRDIFLKSLRKLGCQYEILGNGTIRFGYQGETFDADAENTSYYVYVRDPLWLRISQEDIDDMARLRRVINEVNINCHVRTVYTMWDDDKSFNVHSMSTFMFSPHFPDNVNYLRAELDSFFYAKRFVYIELEKLRQKEKGDGA